MSRATSADNATATATVATASQTISVRAIVPLARLQGALLPLVGRSILTDRGDRGKTGRRQRGVGRRPAGSQPGGRDPPFFSLWSCYAATATASTATSTSSKRALKWRSTLGAKVMRSPFRE